jgi:ABC-type glutathione transport system ATPase component
MNNSGSGKPLLSVRELTKTYSRGGWLRGGRATVQALRGVDLELAQSATLAIIGASGSGKSTLVRCIAGIEQPSGGEILYDGRPIHDADSRIRPIQLIFQDPGASLNPRLSVEEALEEPLFIHHDAAREFSAREILAQVGLPASLLARRTSELSGGQKARLALARALLALGLRPNRVLILDESLSSLDLSTQAQIINLLVDLQASHGLAYILIAHDLSLAAHMADQIAVMFEGKIVERGVPEVVLKRPDHPQTRCLLSAALTLPEAV